MNRFGWVVHLSNPEDAKRVLLKHGMTKIKVLHKKIIFN
jgi:hypothetical protein